jgi:Leucine Rich repeat
MPFQPAWNRACGIARRRDDRSIKNSLKSRPGGYTDPSEKTSTLRAQQANMTNQAKTVSRPRRRFLRFSVRGMILLVLVIGIWMGWIARSARIQREAVAAIERAGGYVGYAPNSSDGNHDPGVVQRVRKRLVGLVGIDFLTQVTTVGLTPNGTDALMIHVGHLTSLERLSLYGHGLSDAELVHLSGLTKLSYLNIDSTQLTDAGLAHLKALTNLTYVDFEGTQFTDTGLRHLKGLTKLTTLNLRDTKVTDAGVKELLDALPKLTIVR